MNKSNKNRELKRGPKQFNRKKQKKLNMAFGLVLIAIVLLNIQIIRIQAQKGDEYTKQVLSQNDYSSKTIPFRRGDIKDRNGNLLATSQKVYNLVLDCKALNANEDYKVATIGALGQCYPELFSQDSLNKVLADKPNSQYAVLAKKISYEDKKKFDEYTDIKEEDSREERLNKRNIKGIWFEEEYQRSYPNGSLACDLIGFTYSGNVGSWGIEEFYNETLNGENGREYGYLNSETEYENVVKNATNGHNIISTIDINIQKIVEEKILAFNEAHRDEAREGAGSKNTAVIIQNPRNGEILAGANYPVFDLNQPRNLVKAGIVGSEEEAAAMSEEDALNALNRVWRNFCLSDTFEPGSTFKPMTIAMGLETGKLSGNEVYICDGNESVGGHKIHCVRRSGHGQETVSQAIMNSCNDALMQMSYTIGIDTFTKYQSIFGFGKKTTIDLPAEENASNLMYTSDKMTPVDLATNSFGQNFNVTMTQMMSSFSSLINGGNYYQPHVVKKITDSKDATVKTVEANLLRKTISAETSEMVKNYLYETVMNGTAKSALVDGYTMGGKTGTAEKTPRKQGNYVVSFIGYAPAENPQVAIYVVIDEPNVEDQPHSSYATNLSKEIMTEVLPYMNIFPETETQETTQKNIGTIPNNTSTTQDNTSTAQDGETPEEGVQSVFE